MSNRSPAGQARDLAGPPAKPLVIVVSSCQFALPDGVPSRLGSEPHHQVRGYSTSGNPSTAFSVAPAKRRLAQHQSCCREPWRSARQWSDWCAIELERARSRIVAPSRGPQKSVEDLKCKVRRTRQSGHPPCCHIQSWKIRPPSISICLTTESKSKPASIRNGLLCSRRFRFDL